MEKTMTFFFLASKFLASLLMGERRKHTAWPGTLMLAVSAATIWGETKDPRASGSPRREGAKIVEIGAADARETGKLPELTTELSQHAAAAVSKRDWTTAREAYREMLAGDPDNALALANLGSVELQLRDLDAAVEHLDQAVRQRPALTQTWLTLGIAYYEREDNLRALSAISRAVADKPDDPRARNYLAATAKALGWLGAAESELQRALDLDPNYAEAHYNLALIYLDRHPPVLEIARRHYLKAVELGTPRDSLVEKQLNEAGSEETNSEKPESVPAARADQPTKPVDASKPAASKPKPKATTRKPKG
jgi:tetratricopeptide (TPR) repeat protein